MILYILFTNNNILCTFTNLNGKTLVWLTVGSEKIKGTKKITSTSIITTLKKMSLKNKKEFNSFLYIKIKGFNKNKNYFIKVLKNIGFKILFIQDKFNVSYNGCKKRKNRKL